MPNYGDFDLDIRVVLNDTLGVQDGRISSIDADGCGSGGGSLISVPVDINWSVNKCLSTDCSKVNCGWIHSLFHWNECTG